MASAAPYFEALARAPAGGACHWVTTRDGIKIRVGHWPREGAKGTVLVFPGRTEHIEKYGPLATDLHALGLAVAAVDWRGQGIADRVHSDPRAGHVAQFSDYQIDVDAYVDHVRSLGLPEPYYMLAHSMGGGIGLATLYRDHAFAKAAFSAPMWGILMHPLLRPTAWAISWASEKVGLSGLYAPSTNAECYVATAPFDDNTLTTDREMFDFMQQQVLEEPKLQLGGPTIRWLREALLECRRLSALPAPNMSCVTFLGTNERIVDAQRVRDRMDSWPQGELVEFEGAEHEVLMETPETRAQIMSRLARHFTEDATPKDKSSGNGTHS